MTSSKASIKNWLPEHSARFYGVHEWGMGYFDVSANGELASCIENNGDEVSVSLMDIVKGMKDRGLEMPAILRIENLLDQRIKTLNEAFAAAIKKTDYKNHYRGVFPIKVNQQCHVIEEIAAFGSHYHYGLEAGSKAELIIAISQIQDDDSLIICNGYKDAAFIDLGLYARQMGILCFFVIESLAELSLIQERSQILGIEPLIGARIKITSNVEGQCKESSEDCSIFGLSTNTLLAVIEQLKQANMLHCLQMLHCHLGSQISSIRNIRSGVLEICQFYTNLISEGAPMGYLDLGGGLAVDYEGTQTNSSNSMNYQLDEYCVNIIEIIQESLDPLNIAHPVIITESGRSLVAYSSMLLFNILDVRDNKPGVLPEMLPEESHELLINLYTAMQDVSLNNLQECYNDSLYYRDEVRELFRRGQINLRERALAEQFSLAILERIAELLPQATRISSELEKLPELLADIYYGNFSLFQSLPDIWGLNQVFPVMPIHRLNEKPTKNAVIADITCDCDGKIDRFSNQNGITQPLWTKVHRLLLD